MERSEKFQEVAKACMHEHCHGVGICPLKRPSKPVQQLAADPAFRKKVLKDCSRMDCEEKVIAVVRGTCEK